MTLEFHELAALVRESTPKERDDLQADIEKHGQLEPIWLHEGKILDGRTRYIACRMLKIEPVTAEYDGDDPAAFVMAKNVHRRHLDSKDKEQAIAYFLKRDPRQSDRSIADQTKVSPHTVVRVRENLFDEKVEKENNHSVPNVRGAHNSTESSEATQPKAAALPRVEKDGKRLARGRPPKTEAQKEADAQRKLARQNIESKEREIEARREAARVAYETGEPIKPPPAPPKPPTDEERLKAWAEEMQSLMRFSPNKVVTAFIEGLKDWDEDILRSMQVQRRHAAASLFATRLGFEFDKAAA